MDIRATTALKAPSDFGRLENLDHSFNLRPEMPSYFQAFDQGRPIGSLALFTPTADTAEVSAFVQPARRRQGVFTALLREAAGTLGSFGYRQLLFPCQGSSEDGQAVAAHWGAVRQHTEYLMSYRGGRPALKATASLRAVSAADLPAIEALYAAVFPGNDGLASCLREDILCRVLERQGQIAGIACVNLAGEARSIYGVAVDPAHQGQGLGGALMAALLAELTALSPGAPIGLEVDGTNQPALRLYTRSGFTVRQQMDYYVLRHPATAPSDAG